MLHIPLVSMTFRGTGFDRGDADRPPAMEVVFHDGSIRRYSPVSEDQWSQFLACENKAQWLALNTGGLSCQSKTLDG